MEHKELTITSDLDIEQEEIEIIGVHTLCRLCSSQNDKLIGIYSEEGIGNDLSNKINLYLPIKVTATDELPLQCCWNCASTLLAWHELVITSVETDRRFRGSQFIATEKQIIEGPSCDSSAHTASDDNDADGTKDAEIASSTPGAKCAICQKTISRARDLKRHISTCHPELDEDKGIKHSVSAKWQCTECNLKLETHVLLNKHTEEVHRVKQKRYRRKKAEIVAAFFCDVCEKGFTRKHDMEKHRSRMHPNHVTDRKKRKTNLEVLEKCRNKASDGKVYYECDFCDKMFTQSYNFMRHRTIHTGVREYFCHICGKSFRMSNGLNRHIEAFHHGVKKFSCEVCKKMFSARATLDEHMNIHTNSRPFVCDVCGKSFKQKASLHVHKMFHSDKFRFQCSYCDKKFRRNQDLKVHVWLHTGHKPHACPKCKAAFRLKHDLTRHLRIHEKLSECACPECGSTFSQQRYLKVHQRIHKLVPVLVKIENLK